MKWGAKAAAICKAAEEEGEDPASLPFMQSHVPVKEHLTTIWDAWHDLSTTRPQGQGFVGRIPWTAADAYAARMGWDDPDQFQRFWTLIYAMDGVFIDHFAELLAAEIAKATRR